jgi:hypothetical protein
MNKWFLSIYLIHTVATTYLIYSLKEEIRLSREEIRWLREQLEVVTEDDANENKEQSEEST